ncbi:MAG: hypothetical protein JRC60_07600 [Deltaproteobacteria bacterium]|nr:hypothetical protein [Deltaproteobacteria bacterium]
MNWFGVFGAIISPITSAVKGWQERKKVKLKDEWFTIILSIPAIMCFIPGLATYVERGFEALSGCPDWYKWAFMVAVASSFGYRKIADFMALKKGA